MAEENGYEIVDCEPASDDLITSVETHFSKELDRVEVGQAGDFLKLRWSDECEDLFHYGWNLYGNQYIFDRCGPGVEWGNIVKHMIALQSTVDQSPIQRPGLQWVYIYKPIRNALDTSVGLFKVIPGSHKMGRGKELDRATRKDIVLGPNQALIIDGRLVIDWPTTGGGVCLRKMIEAGNGQTGSRHNPSRQHQGT